MYFMPLASFSWIFVADRTDSFSVGLASYPAGSLLRFVHLLVFNAWNIAHCLNYPVIWNILLSLRLQRFCSPFHTGYA
jgi:hypothetical protein